MRAGKFVRDKLPEEQIVPEFYAILKDRGLATARKEDGNYYDRESQHTWLVYQQGKATTKEGK